MSTQRTSKTHEMINGFMIYHNKGYTIPEIADVFGVSDETIYRNLGEIARNSNVSRESLLAQPKTIVRNIVCSDDVDLKELVANFSRLERELSEDMMKIGLLTEKE